MKKITVFVSAILLTAGVAFAQTPQTPAKTTTTTTTTTTKATPTAKPATSTTTEKKDAKASCDPKTAQGCPHAKTCCSHGTAAPAKNTEAAPEKK